MSHANPLTYCILVTGPAYGTQQAASAYQFAKALLEEGHTLKTIFFYREGVLNANLLTSPATDEFDLLTAWQQLAKDAGCEMHICVSAALRRGVVDQEQAQNLSLPVNNLASGFMMSGLGSLAEAMMTADRTLQF
ncbi:MULTISPECIES: sulfurtransferase complex subunit TusD [Providencia]|uniref:sulfurtransferase complex subunit TusD n=1 Tax=Providencia TaxID=586 RepID=UPI00197DB41B|nr:MULTISPECIES: sulfurtransferase complex subunit TusD [Providencia]HEC8327833.1 sulfurtransferase complex subunit TusD [Providencia rettgeri]MBN4865840.1 sulfurtransferase complex subunit TusD [Providencia stuartii]MBN4875162.1 sulfurtransferase complex subunit TusD [Providencia stuartii]MBN4879853.1 sulfurtransferase complex subunit TusD [Providencia stuartii]MBN4884626.1 sulfurtransferase complex subunit TusD [Providencia stuartii]